MASDLLGGRVLKRPSNIAAHANARVRRPSAPQSRPDKCNAAQPRNQVTSPFKRHVDFGEISQ